MVINWKHGNNVTIFLHDAVVKNFWLCFISIIKFSYWSKFHVNIIIGSGVMTIFFYKGSTRNPEIGNTLVWVLPNISRLEQVGNTKFGANVSNKILLNSQKFQGYSFYRFWVIKGKPTGGVNSPSTHTHTQIRVNKDFHLYKYRFWLTTHSRTRNFEVVENCKTCQSARLC